MIPTQKIEAILSRLSKIWSDPKTELVYSNPWELLIAVILSGQSTDKSVNKATPALFRRFPTIHDYANASIDEIDKYITNINYHPTKAKHICESAQIILQRFNGEVPRTMAELIQLPGVARKTANVVLADAFNVHEGIAVDTHVMRLAQQLGLTKETKREKIEQDLMRVVPKEDWGRFSHFLVLYGRYYCPTRTSCSKCPILGDLCITPA